MKRVTDSFLLPCTVDVFWSVFLDGAYVRSLYMEGLGFKGFEVLEMGDASRKLRIVPKLNVPAVLARLVGDAFAYEEHGVLDRAKSEWTWRMVQPGGTSMPELVSTRGWVRVEAVGEGECRRSDAMESRGRSSVLGGVIEAAAEKEARSAWSKELPFFREWLAAHPQGTSTRSAPPTSTEPRSAR